MQLNRPARLARLACLVVAAGAVSFVGIGSHSLWTPDEPRDAAVGKAMWASGDLIVPRLNGRPFLEKPPLAWWAQAAAYRLLGVSDAVARVPSALFGTLTLLVAFALGRRLGGERAGGLAAGVLASAVQYSEDMGRAIVDPPLVLMVALAYLGFVLLVVSPDACQATAEPDPNVANRRRAAASLLIALAVPLAFLAKGVVGIGLAVGPPVLYLLAAAIRADRAGRGAGNLRATLRLLLPLALLGLPLFAALVLPWALALVHEGGWDALRECLVGNTVGRFLATEAGRGYGHRQPLWYYLPAGVVAFLPWALALPAVFLGGRQTEPSGADRGRRLLIASCLIGVALLSLAASKRALYLVPLLPAAAVPVALWLDGLGLPAAGSGARRAGPSLDPPAAPRLDSPLDRDPGGWDRPTALLLLALAAILPLLGWLAAAAGARGAFHSLPVAPLRGELSAGRLAAAGVAALAVATILLLRLLRHLRAGSTPTAPWLVVPYLVLALTYQTAVKAAVDPLKNPHDLTAAIARLDPGNAPVAAYRPSETTAGIVYFDLGRTVQPLGSPAELAAYFAAHPRGRVVLPVDALRHLPPALRGHVHLLYDETGAKASPFAIAAWIAASAPVTAGAAP
jgi:4-amino-4-deoxy-L-arabinose transferase-like glycosyltransferase